jgi:hypothetical protein
VFFFRHPRPVIDGRAVAVQVAEREVGTDMDLRVLVAPAHKPNATTCIEAMAEQHASHPAAMTSSLEVIQGSILASAPKPILPE